MLTAVDIFAYAVGDLNEPTCANIQFGSGSTATGPWAVAPSASSYSQYLTVGNISSSDTNNSATSVVFEPDVKQEGNYSVTLFTPGCLQDDSCDTRGIVNVTGTYSSSSPSSSPRLIYQTNNYDKYDTIYEGFVDANSAVFRPSVTLTPSSAQKDGFSIVAQRVQFSISNSTSGLNGLYEFDPNAKELDTDFSDSAIDEAGLNLSQEATIKSITVLNNVTYIGGNFSDSNSGFANIFSIGSGNSTALPNGGLNAEVMTITAYEDVLYVGGNFTNTLNQSINGLNNVAAYNTTSQQWQPLGSGVNAAVYSIVSLEVNVTTDRPELCITVNGVFDQLEAFDTNKAVSVSGFGIWVPSRRNWLQNLKLESQAVTGQLSTMTEVDGSTTLLAGTLSSQDMSADDAVYLTGSPPAIKSLDVGIQSEQIGPQTRKRAISGQNVTGVVTGLFYAPKSSGGLNITVLGGHFTATASNGSTIDNLVFLNNTATSTITGLPSGLDTDSAFLALATSQSVLYAGGSVTGSVNGGDVNGLIAYDLAMGDYSYPQPPPLAGDDVAVNAITVRPNRDQIFVGGSFDTAGSLPCPGACVFENGQWNQPGSGLGGSVSAFTWQGNDKLLAGGNLTIDNAATTLVNYDTGKMQWTALNGAAENVPGPVTALTPANDGASEFWVAGKSTNGTAFLIKYDGSSYQSVGDRLGVQTTIRGLSVLEVGKRHADNALVPGGMILLVTGQLNLPVSGNASAALFNGTHFSPFILSTSGNSPGSISQLFSEKTVNFKAAGKRGNRNMVCGTFLANLKFRWSHGRWLRRTYRSRMCPWCHFPFGRCWHSY